jgi:hypothetical protein
MMIQSISPALMVRDYTNGSLANHLVTQIVSTPNHSVWGVFVDRKHKVYFFSQWCELYYIPFKARFKNRTTALWQVGKKNGFGYALRCSR